MYNEITVTCGIIHGLARVIMTFFAVLHCFLVHWFGISVSLHEQKFDTILMPLIGSESQRRTARLPLESSLSGV